MEDVPWLRYDRICRCAMVGGRVGCRARKVRRFWRGCPSSVGEGLR